MADPTLFIVARHNRRLDEALRRTFAGDPSAEVVLDRRRAHRRQRDVPVPVERRRRDRRQLHEVEAQLRRRGWAVVTARA